MKTLRILLLPIVTFFCESAAALTCIPDTTHWWDAPRERIAISPPNYVGSQSAVAVDINAHRASWSLVYRQYAQSPGSIIHVENQNYQYGLASFVYDHGGVRGFYTLQLISTQYGNPVQTGCEFFDYVVQGAPAITLVYNVSGIMGGATAFTAFANWDPVYSAAGNSPTFHWNFGDGNTAVTNTETTSHIYASPGTFTYTVTINDGYFEAPLEARTATISATEGYVGKPALNAGVSCRGSDPRINANWSKPYTGGATIDEYRLEEFISGGWYLVYQGPNTSYQFFTAPGPRQHSLRARMCSGSNCGEYEYKTIQVRNCSQ